MKSILLAVLTLSLVFSGSYLKHRYLYAVTNSHVYKVRTPDGTASAFHVEYKDKVYLVTNRHVCTSKKIVWKSVTVRDKKIEIPIIEQVDLEEVIIGANSVKVIHINKKGYDLCLLEPFEASGLSIGKARYLEPLFSTGHPHGLPHLMKELHFIGQDCDPMYKGITCNRVYIADKSTYGGTSGSPIVDIFGNAVGVVYAGNSIATYIIPISAVTELIDTINDESEEAPIK